MKDFEEVVDISLPNFDVTGKNTVLRYPLEPPVFSTQESFSWS